MMDPVTVAPTAQIPSPFSRFFSELLGVLKESFQLFLFLEKKTSVGALTPYRAQPGAPNFFSRPTNFLSSLRLCTRYLLLTPPRNRVHRQRLFHALGNPTYNFPHRRSGKPDCSWDFLSPALLKPSLLLGVRMTKIRSPPKPSFPLVPS